MERDIYEARLINLDEAIDEVVQNLRRQNRDWEDKLHDMAILDKLGKLESDTAARIKQVDDLEMDTRKTNLEEVVSSERDQIDHRQLDIRQAELELEREKLELEKLKEANRLKENERNRELEEKQQDVEKMKIAGGIFGAGLQLAGQAIGVAGMYRAMGTMMQFEKMDNGGIVPTKFVNMAMKMAKM